MLLAIDVGNSWVKTGIGHAASNEWEATGRFSMVPSRTAEEWYSVLTPHFVQHVAEGTAFTSVTICSVVPSVTMSLTAYARKFLDVEPLFMSWETVAGIRAGTIEPAETGADRLANASAAFHCFGGPVIVADLGTATKIDATTADGTFSGGAIAPGLGLGMESLASRAARLYAVTLTPPESAVGNSTISAVQSGVVLGHIEMVNGLVERISREMGGCKTVVVTGGYSSLVEQAFRFEHVHNPMLTLEGVRLLARRHASS